jgi:outer membrane protein assembly factor BamB
MALMPGGLVTVGSLEDHTATVTGYDLLTGDERWTYEQPATLSAGREGLGYPDVSLVRSGDLVALVPPDRGTVLLSTGGERVRGALVDADATAWDVHKDARTGRLVVTTDGAFRSNRSTFVAPDGAPSRDVVLDGHQLAVQVDDGTLAGIALTAGPTAVHGADVGTGRIRWSVDVESPGVALVLRGRVLVVGGDGVTAVDGRSGNVLWRIPAEDGLVLGNVMTDGRHVLVAYERGDSGAPPVLVAYDPASGREAFRAPYPPGVGDVNPWGRHLMATSAEDEWVQLD